MKNNPLKQLGTLGQSIWLDYLHRKLLTDFGLKRLIEGDGLRGVTTNSSIFEKAIAGSHEYDEDIRYMTLEGNDIKEIYEALTIGDVQRAADEFRPLYDKTGGKDGCVTLEVNPHLAYQTKATIEEARRLWVALNRPNILIKVPATAEGLPAIRQLISDGINVNATLLFGLPRYRQVAEAYLAGLEARLIQRKPLAPVASVASFSVSRIDSHIDAQLEKIIKQGGEKAELAIKLHGQVAVASAKLAYQMYKEIFSGERFINLAAHGARSQRLLWASTGTQNPYYSDVKYIEALIGPETINTAPLETLEAYRDHGDPKSRLLQEPKAAVWILDQLPKLGIYLDEAVRQLEAEGIEKFMTSFDKLTDTLTLAISRYRREKPMKGASSRVAAG